MTTLSLLQPIKLFLFFLMYLIMPQQQHLHHQVLAVAALLEKQLLTHSYCPLYSALLQLPLPL
jgi:hypothetical protein